MQKQPILAENHGLTPLKKSQFFDFLNFFFLRLKNHFFVVAYRKPHFPGLYCIKKNMKKQPFLAKNHALTPLKKSQFFDFLNTFFLFQNIIKHILLAYIALQKNMEKQPILAENYGLTPLKKSQFFDCLNFLFAKPKKTLFRSRVSQKTFSWPTLP